MSMKDVERFVIDLKTNAGLQEEIKVKDGGNGGMAVVVSVAKTHGYDISVAEVNEFILTQPHELTEGQLKAVTGGVVIAIIAILIGLVAPTAPKADGAFPK